MGRRWHSSIFDVRSFRAADCDTDHYLVVATVSKRLAVSKQTVHRVCMERFNLKKLNEVEDKEQSHVQISNRFANLENLDNEVDINRAWETIRENIKISANENLGYYELKKCKSWFNEGCSELLNQRKQAKLKWLQDPSKINMGHLNTVRGEARRHFRNKMREYLKDKIDELATNSKNKNTRDLYRGINEFKRVREPPTVNLALANHSSVNTYPRRWNSWIYSLLLGKPYNNTCFSSGPTQGYITGDQTIGKY
jgi:hypothetical protein